MSFGSTPKVDPPKIIPPATPPSQDQAAERATASDRALFRRGRAATRLTGLSSGASAGSGGAASAAPGRSAAYRLLSGAQ